jgi:hypothetical protein
MSLAEAPICDHPVSTTSLLPCLETKSDLFHKHNFTTSPYSINMVTELEEQLAKLDTLLESYLNLLDTYESARKDLSKSLSMVCIIQLPREPYTDNFQRVSCH